MVTSRATSDCQSLAALITIVTAPVASAARKVMMATTAVSERPAIEPLGTMGVCCRCSSSLDAATSRSVHVCAMASKRSLVDMQPALVQDQPSRIVFVHQRDIVGGDHNGRA